MKILNEKRKAKQGDRSLVAQSIEHNWGGLTPALISGHYKNFVIDLFSSLFTLRMRV